MSHRFIATILRHDGKQTSYKIALQARRRGERGGLAGRLELVWTEQ